MWNLIKVTNYQIRIHYPHIDISSTHTSSLRPSSTFTVPVTFCASFVRFTSANGYFGGQKVVGTTSGGPEAGTGEEEAGNMRCEEYFTRKIAKGMPF